MFNSPPKTKDPENELPGPGNGYNDSPVYTHTNRLIGPIGLVHLELSFNGINQYKPAAAELVKSSLT